jgi:hypothetical protein
MASHIRVQINIRAKGCCAGAMVMGYRYKSFPHSSYLYAIINNLVQSWFDALLQFCAFLHEQLGTNSTAAFFSNLSQPQLTYQ